MFLGVLVSGGICHKRSPNKIVKDAVKLRIS
jgi:hypothetical protein